MGELSEVLVLSQYLDEVSAKLYKSYAQSAGGSEQKAFWRDVAGDEEEHITYFKKLLVLDEEKKLDHLIDNPEKLKSELQKEKSIIDRLLSGANEHEDISTKMMAALKLESLILNSNFSIFLRILKENGINKMAEEDYKAHLEKFYTFSTQIIKNKPEFELVTKILMDMWRQSRELAKKFYEVKKLQGLIPICSHCKKIRDDKEKWHKLESYIQAHSDAEFSHSICQECAKEHYPDYELYDD